MASPQRFSEVTNPGDEPVLVDEGFEIVEEEGVDGVVSDDAPDESQSASAVPWILLGLLVTGMTATVLLIGLPMRDEIVALNSEKARLAVELKAATTRIDELRSELDTLDAARARLTASVAQKTVALEDSERAQDELNRKLHDEIQKHEARQAASAAATPQRTGRRSKRH